MQQQLQLLYNLCLQHACVHIILNGLIAFFCYLSLCDFFSLNLSGNENQAHLTKGNKFALDRHDGANRHIDGKGRVVIFPFPRSVAFFSPY